MLSFLKRLPVAAVAAAALAACSAEPRQAGVQPDPTLPVYSVVGYGPELSGVAAWFRLEVMDGQGIGVETLCPSRFPEDEVARWLAEKPRREISINPIWSSQGDDFVVMEGTVDGEPVSARVDFVTEDSELCVARVDVTPPEFDVLFTPPDA